MNNPSQQEEIILIGNYPPDQQRSMQRFTDLLAISLRERGYNTSILKPPVIIGKLGAKSSGLGKWLGYIDKYIFAPFYLRNKIRKISYPRLTHICDHSNAFYTAILSNEYHLVTCHDLLAVRSALGEFPQNCVSWTGRVQQRYILRGLNRSAQIACVSRATAGDLSRVSSQPTERIYTVPNALGPEFFRQNNVTATADSSKFNFQKPYLLHVGSDAWYKNRKSVLSIFRLVAEQHPDLQLIIVGPQFSEEALTESGASPIRKRIHYRDSVTDKELANIYAKSEMLIFPSLLEGFGWPILEAQACGTPVLTRKADPMAELNALEELRIDGDPTAHAWREMSAEACLALLRKDASERDNISQRLREFTQAYSTASMAEAYIEIYRKIFSNNQISTK